MGNIDNGGGYEYGGPEGIREIFVLTLNSAVNLKWLQKTKSIQKKKKRSGVMYQYTLFSFFSKYLLNGFDFLCLL